MKTKTSNKLPSYMRPEQPRGEDRDIPTFTIGQRVEAKIEGIEKVTGKFGPQFQFNMTLESGYPVKAWVHYYPIPQPNQWLGKLCLAIERVTGQQFSSVEAAIAALKSYGRVFLEAKQPKQVTGDDGEVRVYPRFGVWPELLPGEQPVAQQPAAQPKMEPVTDLNAPKATKNDLSTAAYNWLVANIGAIGGVIPDVAWNKLVELRLVGDFSKYNLIEMKDDFPHLSERARDYL